MECSCSRCNTSLFNYPEILQRSLISGQYNLFVAVERCENIELIGLMRVVCRNCRQFVGTAINNIAGVAENVRFKCSKILEPIQVNEISSTQSEL